PRIGARRNIQYFQYHHNEGAGYESYTAGGTDVWHQPSPGAQTTATYLAWLPEAWPNGPRLFTAFGMGGLETLAWARYLSRKAPQLVCTVPFAMAEMETHDAPQCPTDLSFMDEWKVDLLNDG